MQNTNMQYFQGPSIIRWRLTWQAPAHSLRPNSGVFPVVLDSRLWRASRHVH